MNLKKIESERIKNGLCYIRINKKGVMACSSQMSRVIGLKAGDFVSFSQDLDNPTDWYFKKSDDKTDLMVRNGNADKTSIIIASASIANKILDSTNNTGSAMFMVSTQPIEGGYYAILTSFIKK